MRTNTNTSNKRRATSHPRGVALIWTAIMLIVLILFVGLAIDVAKIYLAAHQLQNAADAAALAGARLIWSGTDEASGQNAARAAAIAIAGDNVVEKTSVVLIDNPLNDPNGDIVIGRYDWSTKTFTADTVDPCAMKVVARRTTDSGDPISLYFGPIVSVPTADVTRSAVAMVKLIGNGLITLYSACDKPGLQFSGSSGQLIVDNGNIQVNSSVTVSGSAHPIVNADEININCCPVPGFLDPTITQCDQPIAPDPLASLPPPPWDAKKDLSPKDSKGKPTPITSGHYGPGYYSAGIDGAGITSLILDPGIYVLDGVGGTADKPNGLKGSFTANNVMFYIKGSGGVNIIGNQNITVTPPTSGVYKNIAIYQDRADSSTPKNGINGSGGVNIQGTIYLPDVDLLMTGTPGTFGNQIIVDTLDIKGTVNINVNYTGSFGVYMSYLVE